MIENKTDIIRINDHNIGKQHSDANMLSVLLIGNFLSSTKIIRTVCEDLAEQLSASGWYVLTASSKINRLYRLCDMIFTVWSKRHQYKVAQVDVYSGPSFIWAEVVCWSLKLLGKSYIITLHGGNLPVFAQHWPKRVKRLLRNADIVTSPSRFLMEKMISYRADLQLLPNPLDLSAYKFKQRKHPRPTLIWLRAFHGIYNPMLAVQILALLVNTFPDIHLTMIGPDKGDGSLQNTKQTAIDLEVTDHLTIIEGISKTEISQWMNKGDIFINTTNMDNTPISVLEAMACGLCVISTNVGGISYLLKHEENALLVPSNNPETMVLAVNRLINEEGLAEQLSINAYNNVQNYNWPIILLQWEKLLKTIIGNHLQEAIAQ